MPVHQGVWGIDLGQCALKALRLEVIDGVLTATAFDYVEHPKILHQPDADPDQLTREALEKFLSRNSIKGDIVAISVPGQSGLARFVKLPPVEEKKIADIVQFEAKQQIPFPLDEVVWDYQKIGSGEVTDGFAMETEIGLFAMKRDMVNRYLAALQGRRTSRSTSCRWRRWRCATTSPTTCSTRAAPRRRRRKPPAEDEGPRGKKQCVVALDIGTDSSNLVITDGEKIIWQRPIPLGGNHFTRALTKDLKLTFAKAEHLKRNAAKSPDLKKILAALKPVLNDFVGEVQRSLGYFTNTHRDAHDRVHGRPGQRLPPARPAEVPAGEAAAGSPQAEQVRAAGRRRRRQRPGVHREHPQLRGGLRAGPAGPRPGPAAHQPAAAGNPLRADDPGQEAVGGRRRQRPVPGHRPADDGLRDQLPGRQCRPDRDGDQAGQGRHRRRRHQERRGQG